MINNSWMHAQSQAFCFPLNQTPHLSAQLAVDQIQLQSLPIYPSPSVKQDTGIAVLMQREINEQPVEAKAAALNESQITLREIIRTT